MTTNNFTWKHFAIIISFVFLLLAVSGLVSTKADKDDVVKAEERSKERISMVQVELKKDVGNIQKVIDKIETKQDKIFDILLEIKKDSEKK